MSKTEEKAPSRSEVKVKGSLVSKGVGIRKKQDADELFSRGYGIREDKDLLLTFHEALYLLDKGMLEIQNENGDKVDFRRLLQCFEGTNDDAWAEYLVYRDLRSRGYVIREGFGAGIDFRVYERGDYSKDTAKYMVLSIQEGKPISLADLTSAMKQCQSSKKELILAVMNRRGEIVYYSVGQLTVK